MKILKSIPWWGWVIIIIAILFSINYISAKAMNRSLFNMTLNHLREDQTQILKDKNEWIKTCEDEILKINAEKEKNAKEKSIAQRAAASSKAEVNRLKGENRALQDLIDHLAVSDDPDQLINDLQRRGIKIRRSRNLGNR